MNVHTKLRHLNRHLGLWPIVFAVWLTAPHCCLAMPELPSAQGSSAAQQDSASTTTDTQLVGQAATLPGAPASPAAEIDALEPGEEQHEALITNDAVIFGILILMLGLVFWSHSSQIRPFQMFYRVVPMLLMCYFLPSLLTLFGIVDPEKSNLYTVVSRYLLPASLVLLTLSVDLKAIVRLGPKAVVMFLTGTVGVVLGGPLAILIVGSVAPGLVGGEGPEAVWRGMTTIAGSWIGGGANQTAMKEVFKPSDELFSVMVAIDVLVAEFWMMFLLLGIGRAKDIDRFFNADSSSVDTLQQKMEAFRLRTARNPEMNDLFVILAIGFGCTGAAHWLADIIAPYIATHYPQLAKFSLDSKFFWLIVLATTAGVGLSFTRLRNYEGAGASKVGTIFIFILVATIGLGMDLRAIVEHSGLFVVGLIWMLIHVGLLILMSWLIRAPYFFLAVGSKANIGGAASAPVVAAAFHPALAPVGVLLAVLGYVLGTYGAYLCGLMMQAVAPT